MKSMPVWKLVLLCVSLMIPVLILARAGQGTRASPAGIGTLDARAPLPPATRLARTRTGP